ICTDSSHRWTEVDSEGARNPQKIVWCDVDTRYSLKDKIEAKPDKTESGIGKSEKNQGQRY
ncbi:hypothetical protein Tco_0578162, partial [Tanacetum coccineum]